MSEWTNQSAEVCIRITRTHWPSWNIVHSQTVDLSDSFWLLFNTKDAGYWHFENEIHMGICLTLGLFWMIKTSRSRSLGSLPEPSSLYPAFKTALTRSLMSSSSFPLAFTVFSLSAYDGDQGLVVILWCWEYHSCSRFLTHLADVSASTPNQEFMVFWLCMYINGMISLLLRYTQ